jgi:hypothetical protein
MNRCRTALLAAGLGLVPLAGLAEAQQPSAEPAIEAGAMDALKRMAAYLRELKAFQVEVATTDEDVLDDGQKIQYTGVTTILVQRPNRLRAEVTNDRRDRLFLYDGKTFTLFAKRVNYYATVPAPPTIAELADLLEEKYDVSVPLADLFRWGAPGWSAQGIKGAMDVGPSAVLGTTCEQYAFHLDDIDWQVWIQKGDHPLPRRLVITTKTDEARPQHTSVYTWNLAPSFNDAAFAFDPPPGVGKVALAGGPPAAAQK